MTAPNEIFASQGDDGWRWPRASKFPEQGGYENISYTRTDLYQAAIARAEQAEARVAELEWAARKVVDQDAKPEYSGRYSTLRQFIGELRAALSGEGGE